MFLNIFSGDSSLNGKAPVNISYTIIPNDQKSNLNVCSSPKRTSGAI
jgi:hypothetical protein